MKTKSLRIFTSFNIIFIILLILPLDLCSQELSEFLYKDYRKYQVKDLQQRRFKHADIIPLIDKLREKSLFEINKVGESINGRSLNLISLGNGNVDVFLWSQMHGDESTATLAIFDILNYFSAVKEVEPVKKMLSRLRIHFLPMLNPDGAEEFMRRNALGIDVNRDALRLQSPEARVLKRVRDSLEADFGFNLHDQSRYYNAERTDKPASISFLAPAYNYEKQVNEVRSNAMKLIVVMNNLLQKYAPGQVGRYNDDFEPRAFGDNIQKWGTSTILIESGGYPGDREKQEIRKLNFVAILSALHSIAMETYLKVDTDQYNQIPNNDRNLFDLKVKEVNYELLGNNYLLDLGINLYERDSNNGPGFYFSSGIVDQGDLSTSYAYDTFDASGYKLEFGRVYSDVLEDARALSNLAIPELLEQGILYVRLKELPKDSFTNYPVNLVSEDFKLERELRPGKNASFILKRNGEVEYVIINGFLTTPREAAKEVENALILR